MARLFTINFLLEDKHYGALVNLSQHEHDLSCTVRYLDERIHMVLNSDCLKFNLTGGLQQPAQLDTPLAEELVLKTAEAISAHLDLQQIQ